MKRIRGRFAPSPSGRMHLGNLFAALLAWLDVRSLGGEMLLRMEDLDPARCRSAYAMQLAEDLQWLGLDWDVGWQPDSEQYTQSRRTDVYETAFRQLSQEGLIYPCFCTRKELLAASAPHASDGFRVYDGHCRLLSDAQRAERMADGRKPAYRVEVPAELLSFTDEKFGRQAENLKIDCGDFILRRSDGVYAYQLAVAVDDGQMGITRVVRGCDLLSSTPRQLWLMKKLGYTPPTYCHLPLLVGEDGRRLAKRDRDWDVGLLRARTSAPQVVGVLAYTAGLIDRPAPIQPQALVPLFAWDKVGRQDRVVEQSALGLLLGKS